MAKEPLPESGDLRSNVGNLIQTITSFNKDQEASPGEQGKTLPPLSPAAATGVSNIDSILGVLQQYDSNGNVLGKPVSNQSISSSTSLTTAPNLDAITSGILTFGK